MTCFGGNTNFLPHCKLDFFGGYNFSPRHCSCLGCLIHVVMYMYVHVATSLPSAICAGTVASPIVDKQVVVCMHANGLNGATIHVHVHVQHVGSLRYLGAEPKHSASPGKTLYTWFYARFAMRINYYVGYYTLYSATHILIIILNTKWAVLFMHSSCADFSNNTCTIERILTRQRWAGVWGLELTWSSA